MLTLRELEEWAGEIGFDDFGAARVRRLDQDAEYLQRWLHAGSHGSMHYLAENFEKRVNPKALVPEAETVLVCLLNYYIQEQQVADAPRIAKSGLAEIDYHIVMKTKLLELAEKIMLENGKDSFSNTYQYLFCDSAPILERRWAQLAGLGWIGKNKQLIHPHMGSFVHIGILLLNTPLNEYSRAYEEDGCKDCNLCVTHCPTGALRMDMFDARRCVSYLTIERKEPLEDKYKHLLKNNLYGCDVCATVCPYNAHLQASIHKGLAPNKTLLEMTRQDWEQTSRRQRIKLLHRLAPQENETNNNHKQQ